MHETLTSTLAGLHTNTSGHGRKSDTLLTCDRVESYATNIPTDRQAAAVSECGSRFIKKHNQRRRRTTVVLSIIAKQ